MKLDRNLQRELLSKIALCYPERERGIFANDVSDDDEKKIIANLLYLQEHGLVESGLTQSLSGNYTTIGSKITAKGMDFLADDGGLSAILGVVTIRLHDDTIRELIALKIQDSDLPQPDKHRLLDQLRELRGESIKHLTMKLLDAGLENWQKALPLVQKALESFG
jgi:hypothetical protein